MSEKVSNDDTEWIRRELERTGATQRALARALGVHPSNVSRLLEGARRLAPEEAKLLRGFFSALDVQPGSAKAMARDQRLRHDSRTGIQTTPARLEIPVFGLVVADEALNAFSVSETPIEYRGRPRQLDGVIEAYAVMAPCNIPVGAGKSWPRYFGGEVIFIHPHKPPPLGAVGILRLEQTRQLRFVLTDSAVAGRSTKSSRSLQKIVACVSE